MLAEALALAATLSYPACVTPIEQHFRLPPGIVPAIIRVESGGNPAAVNRGANRNGTTDYGLMQINSIHLPRLAAHGVDEQVLLSAPCINVAVGADVLHQGLTRTGGALAPALSKYNTGRPDSSIGAAYAARVLSHFGEGAPLDVWVASIPSVTPERSPLLASVSSGGFSTRAGGFSPAQSFAR